MPPLPPHLIHYSAEKKPVIVWNSTRSCNLFCMHCYAEAKDRDFPGELTTEEGFSLIDDIAAFGAPTNIFSGGEPLMRPDILELAARAALRGLRCVLSTNGTLITDDLAVRIREAGFAYVGISLDGIGAAHDKVRGRAGAFEDALAGIRRCRDAGVKVGIRFTLHGKNVDQLPGVVDLLEAENVPRFCMYHLAYAGRAQSVGLPDRAGEGLPPPRRREGGPDRGQPRRLRLPLPAAAGGAAAAGGGGAASPRLERWS